MRIDISETLKDRRKLQSVEKDTVPVARVALYIFIALGFVLLSVAGINEVFRTSVAQTVYDQQLSKPNSQLVRTRTRSAERLAGAADPVTGETGIAIFDAMKLLVIEPNRLKPVDKLQKYEAPK